MHEAALPGLVVHLKGFLEVLVRILAAEVGVRVELTSVVVEKLEFAIEVDEILSVKVALRHQNELIGAPEPHHCRISIVATVVIAVGFIYGVHWLHVERRHHLICVFVVKQR